MASTELQRLQAIRSFPSLVKYLRDELDWPIESDDFDELTFDYEPEELGIDSKTAVKIKEIKQLRPLDSHQPWGIFFVNFEPKRLPIVVLRRILRSLVVKKRSMAATAHQATWKLHDLLFISSYGESEHRELTFAHFNEPHDRSLGDLPTLKVLGWDAEDTLLRLDPVVQTLSNKLRWPENGIDPKVWSEHWSDAFVLRPREVIRKSRELAVGLADLAKSIRNRANVILKYESETGPLRQLHKAFQTALIHDLTLDDFADMYAQTIAYGLLAASVSRPMGIIADNLKDMVPITNPFLKEIMGTFLSAGGRKGKIDFDELGIQEIVDLLNSPNTHMEDVLRDFGNRTMQEDPVIHFYELFLKEYDSEKKVKRGVFYTPQPVVSYIVRSVHELLQTDFGLEDGLASTVTWGEMARLHKDLKIPDGVPPEQPFVQILDPATGTATFLVQVIETIHNTMVEKWKSQGFKPLEIENLWNEYVPRDLLPRMYGYELMMAPYAIAHMKIGLKLAETGYDFGSVERVKIYLTNSLEPSTEIDRQFNLLAELAPAMAHEAQDVNEIKRNQRFTVVMGNPPYSVSSKNKSEFIESLMKLYKLDVRHERNIKPLSDDYVKFFRLAHFMGANVPFSVICLITNNSFMWGPTFYGMRRRLMADFEPIRFLNLHGDSLSGETHLSVEKDENVFDIRQGVVISLLLRSPKSGDARPSVSSFDLYGSRESKYRELSDNDITPFKWVAFPFKEPGSAFVHATETNVAEYKEYPSITAALAIHSKPIITKRDHIAIHFDRDSLLNALHDLSLLPHSDFVEKYGLEADSRDWTYAGARRAVETFGIKDAYVRYVNYRPFDKRWTYYVNKTKGFMAYPVFGLLGHMLQPNLALCIPRQINQLPWIHCLAVSGLTEFCYISNKTREANDVFTLYSYEEISEQSLIGIGSHRRPNFGAGFLGVLSSALGLPQTGEHDLPRGMTPEDIFHYIYALFHSPVYRARYAEFLKIDFPRLPLTSSLNLFQSQAKLGGDLVALHLMESPKLNDFITSYTGPKDPEVKKVGWSHETVWLDAAATKKGQPARPGTMGFRGVPEDVWNFHIGGYQVCQKWLKDRKGRTLSENDISHYQKIIVALHETIRIMREIDEVIEKHGGWPGAFVGKN